MEKIDSESSASDSTYRGWISLAQQIVKKLFWQLLQKQLVAVTDLSLSKQAELPELLPQHFNKCCDSVGSEMQLVLSFQFVLCNPNSLVLVFCSVLWDDVRTRQRLAQMPNGSGLDYLEEDVVLLKSCRFNYKSNDVV